MTFAQAIQDQNIVNFVFCLVIFIYGIVVYQQTKRQSLFFVALAFGLFGLTHFFTLLGLTLNLTAFMIFLRMTAYIVIIFALFKGATER